MIGAGTSRRGVAKRSWARPFGCGDADDQIRWVLLVAIVTFFAGPFVTTASAEDLTCLDYVSFAEGRRISLAYGYLEGVQAALDKEIADILAPPSDPRHPM